MLYPTPHHFFAALLLVTSLTPFSTISTQAQTLANQPSAPASPIVPTADNSLIQNIPQLNQQIEQFYQRGEYRSAIPLVQQVLKLQRQSLGDRHPDVASSLNKLAFLYTAQGQYELAEPIYQQTLELQKTVLGDQHPLYATSLDQLAGLYLRQGRYDLAEPLHQQALDIRQTQFGDRHPETATSFKNLALLYQQQGRYKLAERMYQKALASLKATVGEQHPYVPSLLASLASLYVAQGRYQQAEPLYQQTLDLQRNAQMPNAPGIASTLHRLALLYLHQGRYDLAEPIADEALDLSQTSLGEGHPYIAASRNILASIYRFQGRFDLAESQYQQSLALVRSVQGDRHPHVADSLNNLALLYFDQGRYAAAESFAKQALDLRRTLLGEAHPDVAVSSHNLALIYTRQTRYDRAEPLYQQALKQYQATLGDRHPSVLASLQSLAALYQQQGQYDIAETLHQQALNQAKATLGGQNPLLAQSFNAMASLYHQQGRYELAVNLLQQGLEIEEINLKRNLAVGAEAQKRQYIAQIQGTTDAAISLHLQNAPDNRQAAQLALTTILRRKGRVLDASSHHLQTLQQNLTMENQTLLQQLNAKRRQLAALYYTPPQFDLEPYHQKLRQLTQQADALEAKLAQRSRTFKQENQAITIDAVQQHIPTHATLLEFMRYQPFQPQAGPGKQWGQPRYAAYMLQPDGTLHWVDLGEVAVIDPLVQQFRQALSQRRSQTKQIARQLDAQIMQPIREQLNWENTHQTASPQHLLIAPDSQLNLIPFAALVDENHRYLIESYEISYLSSGRDLLRLPNAVASQQPPLVIANPTYDRPSDNHTTAIAHLQTTTAATGPQTDRAGDLQQLAFGPLPGTAAEAAAIEPKLSGAIVLTETAATENAIKQAVAPQILHIATHGFFLEAEPNVSLEPVRGVSHLFRSDILPMATPAYQLSNAPQINLQNALLRSGLALAGFNPRQSGAEDGVLTALEVANLHLRGTQLVVLSACETAVGDVAHGEGVYGLRRSLVLAGSDSQVMSLWKVDDQGTKDLMVDYYDKLMQRQGRSGALRQVQLAAIQSKQYRHPFFWAAFIPSGQWQPLR